MALTSRPKYATILIIMFERTCPICNKVFTTNAGNKRYCSFDCRRKTINRHRNNICQTCHQKFYAINPKKYCSSKCRTYFYQYGHPYIFYKRICPLCKKEFTTFNKGWNIDAEYIIERDNYTCQRCHKKFPINKLNVHHIKPLCHNGLDVKNNLETLCEPCHFSAHRELKEKYLLKLKNKVN